MKSKLLLMLVPLLAACNQKPQQPEQLPASETVISQAVQNGEVLKGEVIPLDTALFRYAYRLRVQGDKAVVLDLHNPDNYYHVFTYPDFKYVSSFGKRGEGPGESIYASNVRFCGPGTVWGIDDGKGRMYQYSGIAQDETPKLEKDLLLDKSLYRSLDFDLGNDTTVLIPDFSGENRFSWASLSTGQLLSKWEEIPEADTKKLEESPSAVAQGWRSFIGFSPDKKLLVAVTQFGDRVDIYDVKTQKCITIQGEDGEPKFGVTPNGYGIPAGRHCYYDVQVTDKHIYTLYDGREFKEMMKDPENSPQGGRVLRVFNHEGEVEKTYVLDRHTVGMYVDEARGILFAFDVNADEQIVRFELK